jgi:ABC-type lipoprotein release transport system permease subunit
MDRGGVTPLLSALAFFVRGSAELVRLLRLTSLAAGVLVGVTIFSVIRITVRERRPDLVTLRSTGARPRQILALYVGRALFLTGVGVAIGYGFGLILVRAVVNVALYGGLPTSLNARVTPTVLTVLLPAVGLFLLIGGLSGFVAAYRGATVDPQALRENRGSDGGGVASGLTGFTDTTLIGWSALVPTAATLTVFMSALLVLTAVVGAVGPLASTGQQTITEPGATHPVASNVPASYASALRSQGVAASPEILLFEVYRGDPIVARGVNFTAYRQLSGVKIRRGSVPENSTGALVGADLARTTELELGETVVLGGSTAPRVTRVTITGTFSGEGIQDDQLLVSLPVARELAGKGDRSVHFVRTSGFTTDETETPSTIVVTDAHLTRKDNETGVVVAATNLGLRETTRTVTVAVDDQRRSRSFTLDSRRSARVFIPFDLRSERTYDLAVGDIDKRVSLGTGAAGDALRLRVPRRVPTNATPRVAVLRGQRPVANTTLRVGTETFVTNERGVAKVTFRDPGETEVVASSGANRASTTVTVTSDATRRLSYRLAVRPDAPSLFTRPQVRLTATNPWDTEIERTVTVASAEFEQRRTIALDPQETTTSTVAVPRRPPGEYDVSVRTDGKSAIMTTYAVQGDERLGSALASSGQYTGGSGISRAIQVVFGNIEALVLALVSLLAVMTVGSATAAFTRAVSSSKREIGIRRATGATPRDVLGEVFIDALKIGTIASGLAISLAFGLVRMLLSIGELRVFGLVLEPVVTPVVIAGAVGSGVGLSVVSASLAAVAVLRTTPAALLVDRHIPVPTGHQE